jgi:[pyruvate, water dikinase]-phosphate phosphotransferase / [pyruvate, water dikinase] kinase
MAIVDELLLDGDVFQQGGCGRLLVHSAQQAAQKTVNYFHLHLVSDATGETLIAAGRAASSQYENARAIEHVYPLIRTKKQLDHVLEQIDANPGIILHTILDRKLAEHLDRWAGAAGLPAVSVLEPVISIFQSYLGAPAGRRVGAQHILDTDYFRRIDALNFTMEHDDGRLPQNVDEADVVIVGISRTSKTPTSIYLANRGVKTANVPIVLDVPLPEALVSATKPLIVGLVATAERISQVRENRLLGMAKDYHGEDYIDRALIAKELTYARRLCERHDWPVIDVTRRSIEETAAAILALRHSAR